MKSPISITLATLAAVSAAAVDLSGLASLEFAERYAFSTNRQSVVDSLRPRTKEWFVYSIFNAQVEGRLDDADALIKDWEHAFNYEGVKLDRELFDSLRDRQNLLRYDEEKDGGKDVRWRIRQPLLRGVWDWRIPGRESEVLPNTYPSTLDQAEVSFDAFWKHAHHHPDNLEKNFRFLTFRENLRKDVSNLRYYIKSDESTPDAPYRFDLLLDYYADADRDQTFNGMGIDKSLTLPQLAAVAKKLAGTPKDVTKVASYADIVLSKLVPGTDDDPDDPALRQDLLEKRLAFTRTLAPSLHDRFDKALRELLDFYRGRGDFSHGDLFMEYLQAVRPKDGHVFCDAFVRDWIVALRQSGAEMAPFEGPIEKKELAKLLAEADLLAGVPAGKAGAGILSAEEFKALQDRVELNWAGGNKPVFAADDDVALDIDVKGVSRLRVAIYDLDAFEACCAAKGEVRSDIDLDYAVANVERFVEFKDVAPVVRHRERLAFPELKRPGLYVVECSAKGVSSRAVIRKGRLRVTERRDSAGHVFTALDEKGVAVKGARLKVDDAVFEADEKGEIAVPFAQTKDLAVRKTAIVGAGRLAAAIEFNHAEETLSLALQAVLSQESLVAGCEATALLRPVLRSSGVQAPVELLENSSLSIVFDDAEGRSSVVEVKDFKPSSSEESVVRFMVPKRLVSLEFKLSALARRATDGERTSLEASSQLFQMNGILRTDAIRQYFLRRTSAGYVIECRGRTGERMPNLALDVSFKHKAFRTQRTLNLQCDANGELHLGTLADIVSVSCGGMTWILGGDGLAGFPSALSAAEGETLEIPARGLFEGEWPGAQEMASRVSLLATAQDGSYTGDYIGACSYTNGVLRLAGLPAGDYRLALRAEGLSATVRIASTAGAVGDGAAIAGAARWLTDTGAVPPLRVASAGPDAKGRFVLRLANANDDTRVHVFARRTAADYMDYHSPTRLLAAALDRRPVLTGKWGGVRSDYISGRDLGDKLRYVLDRRQAPPRIGNMLDKPSMLLSPWSTTETDTREITFADGEAWEQMPQPESAESAGNAIRRETFGSQSVRGNSFFSFDFLPDAEKVAANLKPDAAGVVTIDLASFKGMQDFTVVAFDGKSIDEVRFAVEAVPFQPRDLRLPDDFDPLAASRVEKRYSTVADLQRLLSSLDPDDDDFGKFAFVAGWAGRSDAEKRELYGKYACHELDLFLHEKDAAFFGKVVAPNLRNKRFKQFIDKWLLGEDLLEYAAPGRLQDLNALEQCLLAMRVKEAAPVVARMMVDTCAAAEPDYRDDDIRLAVALDEMFEKDGDNFCAHLAPQTFSADDAVLDAKPVDSPAVVPAAAAPQALGRVLAEVKAARDEVAEKSWSDQRSMIESPALSRNMAESARRRGPSAAERRIAEMKRRNARQFYRPPERTKEWVETHYWRRRHADGSAELVPQGRFWRDLAAAVAEGSLAEFRPQSVIFATSSFTEKMAVLAFARLGFEARDGVSIVFSRGKLVEGGKGEDSLRVVQRFRDPEAKDADGNEGAEVSDEFVAGRIYSLETVVMNPTRRTRRIRLRMQVPCGAIAVGEESRYDQDYDGSYELGSYDIETEDVKFYFPVAGEGVGRLIPAAVFEQGVKCAEGEPFRCNVVAVPSRTDTNSWHYVSQNGSDSDVLAFLERENLSGLDLAKIGWRMGNADFARKALAILDSRGAYCDTLWFSGLTDAWKDAFDEGRIRQALARRENARKLAPRLGPVFKTSLVEIEPEREDIFEHREYWPVINARAHQRGGAPTIANESLAAEYRAFLDVLAAKRVPTAEDRLLAAVYLLAQDRVDEAAALVAAVSADDVATKMQRDYILAYLAFSAGRPADGRAIAAKYAGKTVAPWDARFREMVALADEVSRGGGAGEAASAPTLSLRAETAGGALQGVALTARNLASCTVSAYPVDVEIAFSKDPFGTSASGYGNVVCVRPAWSAEVKLDGAGEKRVAIPKELGMRNLVIAASGAGGRVGERIESMPGSLDVQVSREFRQLRVRDTKGKPLAGAYVKVYARDAFGREVKFHKDGYTDLRGAFDYEAVSTDTDFLPAAYAILVQDEANGVRILRVDSPRFSPLPSNSNF